VIQDYIENI